MRARKRAQRTIVKQAALDVIKLKKAGGKYGYLTKVVKQYDVYGITREQLKHAVNKIETMKCTKSLSILLLFY